MTIGEHFKLPIEYLPNKESLKKNIVEDLELNETKDDTCTPLYNIVFDPKTSYSKETTTLWNKSYTTNTQFLKDSQTLIKNIKCNVSSEVESIYDSWTNFKNNNNFKEQYSYFTWDYLDKLNYSVPAPGQKLIQIDYSAADSGSKRAEDHLYIAADIREAMLKIGNALKASKHTGPSKARKTELEDWHKRFRLGL